MTEREIAEVGVRQRALAIHPQIGSCTGSGCWGCERLTSAMGAVRDAARHEQAEQVAKMTAAQHVCTHCGYVTVDQNIAHVLADRDARLARLVEAARALEVKLDAMEGPVDSGPHISQAHSAPYSWPTWLEERRALRAALADAGAGKERGDG